MNKIKGRVAAALAIGVVGMSPVYAEPATDNEEIAMEETPISSELKVHKTIYNSDSERPEITNTGKEQELADGVEAYDGEAIEFTLIDITSIVKEYKLNTNERDLVVTKLKELGIENAEGAKAYFVSKGMTEEEAMALIDVQSTDEKGIATFGSNDAASKFKLNSRRTYLLLETKVPTNKFTEIEAPLVINTEAFELNEEEINRDGEVAFLTLPIHIYPKNEVSDYDFEFKKLKEIRTDKNAFETDAFVGVEFDLYKLPKGVTTPGPESNPEKVNKEPLVTNELGKITLEKLSAGTYYFVEIGKEGEITDMPGGTGELHDYLLGFDALNDENNKLVFTVESGNDMQVLTAKYTNYLKPSLEKEAKDKKEGFTIGDRINYTSTLRIPEDIAGGEDAIDVFGVKTKSLPYGVFRYTDMPDSHLIYGKGLKAPSDVKVMAGAEELILGEDYMMVGNDDGSFTIDFIVNGGKVTDKLAAEKGKDLVISYSLILNKDLDAMEFKNEAKLEFLNKPFMEEDKDKIREIKDEEIVKAYGKKFKKTDEGVFGSGIISKPLEGVKFVISKEKGKGYYTGLAEKDGVEVANWSDDIKDALVFTSDSKGEFEVKGLSMGKYFLTETEGLEGYQELTDSIEFEVDEKSYSEKPIVVKNYKNPDMPMTGSERIVLVVGAGAVLIGGAYFYKSKEKNK